MSRKEALAALSSPEADVRLKAVRFLAMNAKSCDRRKLRAALNKETVPWIKRALERSLSRTAPPTGTAPPEGNNADLPERTLAELRAAAIDEVAGTIIHELSTIVGRLRLVVPQEVRDYPGSATKNLVDLLQSLLAGIRNLKTASSKPDYAEVDLSTECRETCKLVDETNVLFRFAGPSPFLAEIDVGLFKLALSNVVRNAVEALRAAAVDYDATITLNWGRAGHEMWVAIIDSGPGFDHDPASLVDLGKSTKDKHIGFGLATTKQAMQAMEGDVYPTNAAEGGARVELRWFASHENPIR